MKKFLVFIFKFFLIILVGAFVLDLIYTNCFLQSTKRDKIAYIFNTKPKVYDAVILGSSRANNHIVTEMFTDKGLVAFNFGMQGSKLFESDLILKLLLDKGNKIKTVIVDVDVTLKTDKKSEATILKFLPYLHQSDIIQDHLRILPNYSYFNYIPFYRYLKYDSKIGFREAFFSGINKKSKELDFGGFSALTSKYDNSVENLEKNPLRNIYYEELRETCKKNNINLVALMMPVCENAVGMNYFAKVKKMYPEVYNYENVVREDRYFKSCGHMNDIGAKIFTAKILKDFFHK